MGNALGRASAARIADGGARRVFFHVGGPKTGTTYLQSLLFRHRHDLARDGVLYPARRSSDHFRAMLDLRGLPGAGRRVDPTVPGTWDDVVSRAKGWRGTVVISQENLGQATPEQVRRAVRSVQPAQIHVIYTARDLERVITAQWQETLKLGGHKRLGRFVRDIVEGSEGGAGGRLFWEVQDIPAVLQRWGADVPAEHVHLVTVPPAGAPPTVLWERFGAVLGIDTVRYAAADARPNVSLGVVEADALRRINQRLGGALDLPHYDELVKRFIAEQVLIQRPDPIPIKVPPGRRAWVRQRAERLVAELDAAGYDVVGDLDELRPRPDEDTRDAPQREVESADVLDATLDVVSALLLEVERQQAQPARTYLRQAALGVGRRHGSAAVAADLFTRARRPSG